MSDLTLFILAVLLVLITQGIWKLITSPRKSTPEDPDAVIVDARNYMEAAREKEALVLTRNDFHLDGALTRVGHNRWRIGTKK